MRSFRYSFRGEEELEALLVEMWIRVEELHVATPEIEIRRHAGADGILLINLEVDPCLERDPQTNVLRLKCRHRAVILAGCGGYRPVERQSRSIAGRGCGRRQRRQSQRIVRTW
jgi:hypothetical protein